MTNVKQLSPAPYDANAEASRHAHALSAINKMSEELVAAKAEIAQLKADLHREEDRVVLIVEERNKYRTEATLFRDLLVELATQQSNIGLLTVKAQDVLARVDEVTRENVMHVTPAPEPVTLTPGKETMR